MEMKVAAIQHDIVWADRAANFAHLESLISSATKNGATFVVLSEMFSTGFVVDDDSIAEDEGGPSSQFLVEMATRYQLSIAGSCPERTIDDPRPFNSLVVASPDGLTTRYRKIHPFTYGNEHLHFRPGTAHVSTSVDGVRVALSVCYDLRFADEYWVQAPSTDLFIVPANWPTSRREHWMSLLRARAIENQAYVIGCNRVGTGGKLHYSGDSMIIDPLGTVLAQGDDTESIIYADIDASEVARVRAQFPFMQDRRQ